HTRNAGQRIHLLAHWEVLAHPTPISSAPGYEFLCSYTWAQTAAGNPTIYVPGRPPKWTPPALPTQLEKDHGHQWRDQHAYRTPTHQFEPVFQALAVMNPNVRFDDVDVVVNRNSLQKLFDFATFKRGTQFHVSLDMVHNTLFIGRQERNARTAPNSGYGRSFEAAFTSADPNQPLADGHHRVIKYALGGLNLVVRMEADAYYPDAHTHANDEGEFFLNTLHVKGTSGIPSSHSTTVIPLALQSRTPHAHTLELKSSSTLSAAMPQMWFGRTPYVCLGKHRGGRITAADVVHLQRRDFAAWEEKHQRGLRRLAWLLADLKRVVTEKGGGAALLVAIERGAPVQVFEARGAKGALPGGVVERFW
ncbi:hypothetical protein P153DRAFT_258559, partial [Dothidotthia symphoricarpi CBS 119687]